MSPFNKTFGGILFPLLLIGYGVRCMIIRESWLPLPGKSGFGARSPGFDVHGRAAIFLGIAYLSAGIAMAALSWWGDSPDLKAWHVGAFKVVLGIGIIALVAGITLAVSDFFPG